MKNEFIDEEVEKFEPERWDDELDEMPDSETRKAKEATVNVEDLRKKYEEKFGKQVATSYKNNIARLQKKLAE